MYCSKNRYINIQILAPYKYFAKYKKCLGGGVDGVQELSGQIQTFGILKSWAEPQWPPAYS